HFPGFRRTRRVLRVDFPLPGRLLAEFSLVGSCRQLAISPATPAFCLQRAEIGALMAPSTRKSALVSARPGLRVDGVR
ncbi:MAG TPA: hypothetical protein DCP91_13685, partial [Eggerthellaceae bacterium]|nr:hypothetical protein [Eggerthellaceae bacterium]